MEKAISQVFEKRTAPRDDNLNDLFALVRVVAADVNNTKIMLNDLNDTLQGHINKEDKLLDDHATQLKELNGLHEAIPIVPGTGKRDIAGHHDAHMQMMVNDKEWKRRWQRTKDAAAEVIVKGVIYGFIVIFLTGVVEYIRHPFAPGEAHISVGALK